MRRSLPIILAAVLTVAAGPSFAFQDDGVILIGSVEPLTGIGTAFGAPNVIGKQIAVDEINANGGILVDGKQVKLKLISEDDQAKPEQGVPLFRKLAESDKALVITGSQYSRVTESMWGLLQRKLDDAGDPGLQVPSISFLSMKAGIASISAWSFRNAGSEPDQHELAMKLVEKRFGPFKSYAGAVEANEAHSVAAWKSAYLPALERRHVEPASFVEWYETDRDFSVQIRKLKRAETDLFILSSHFQANVGALLEAKRQAFRPKAIISHIGADAIEMVDLGKDAVEGIVFPAAIHLAMPEVRPLFEAYKERTGERYMPQFAGLGYEGIQIVKFAIEQAGIKNRPETLAEDRRKVRDVLANLKHYQSFAGMELNMNADHDIERPTFLVRIDKGDFKLWWTPDKGYLF
jgi:branched-chain amino acid transport system substrate-binding protein